MLSFQMTLKYLLVLLLFPFTLLTQNGTFKIPASYERVAEATGDLDRDGKEEKVFIYDTPAGKDGHFTRIMYICKVAGADLTLWHKAILGNLADKQSLFTIVVKDLNIARNCIVIKQEKFFGNRNTTYYTHLFRYQDNDWYLIGSQLTLSTNCYGNTVYEANFSTGDIIVSFIPDGGCDGEPVNTQVPKKSSRKYNYKLPKLPLLDHFEFGEYELKIPGTKEVCYY
ncbi:hypothetical protein [Chitinophaga sp. 212800010-3]|uniref:hypothetical protein n=1 Tax=unclassified Chitinophaga TaxID=2619133 RepID=UPI002DEC6450|nr:VCBS repeat-containing protein [Chitinophaga sp. 212800010-3]